MLKRSTYTCFIDAKKVFDRVNHSCLWYKLYNYGIQGKMLSAIQSLYTKGKMMSCVRINNMITDYFDVTCSVKQGDPVSPTLFALYVNDLIDVLNDNDKGVNCGNRSVSALFYADDIVVMSESAQGLQCQLDIISDWCNKWRMELNQSKTKVIHFRPRSVPETRHNFKCGNLDINNCKKYKYLGLFFNEYMDEGEIVKDVAKYATRALGGMISKYKQTGGNLYETYNTFYESCIQPVMLYGAGVWGIREFSKLNVIQNKACKYFLGVPKTTSNVASRGEMGWLTVQAKQEIEVIRLWCRLEKMDKDRLTYNVHKWSLSMSLRNIKTLEYHVKMLLKKADLLEQSFGETVNTKVITNMYRKFKNDQDKNEWRLKIWDDKRK